MERSDSTSSTGSARLRHNSALESGQFAYQKALLERTSSRGGTLSRTGSQSRNTLFNTPTGNAPSSSNTPNATRRWTPTHRVGGSLDVSAVRGKWEERSRAAEGALFAVVYTHKSSRRQYMIRASAVHDSLVHRCNAHAVATCRSICVPSRVTCTQ